MSSLFWCFSKNRENKSDKQRVSVVRLSKNTSISLLNCGSWADYSVAGQIIASCQDF